MSRGAARGDWPRSAPEPDGAGAGTGDLSHITHGDTATSSGGPQARPPAQPGQPGRVRRQQSSAGLPPLSPIYREMGEILTLLLFIRHC